MDACPVRIQVPLLMTVYLNVAFSAFRAAREADGALPPGFFEPPPVCPPQGATLRSDPLGVPGVHGDPA